MGKYEWENGLTVLTKKLNNGFIVLATKTSSGTLNAKTYANKKQAEKALEKLRDRGIDGFGGIEGGFGISL